MSDDGRTVRNTVEERLANAELLLRRRFAQRLATAGVNGAMRADLSYGNTRLHARRGALLRDADYERLLGEDVDGLLGALEDTPYAPDVEAARGDDGLRRLHQTIGSHLSRSLEEMRSFYADRARRLVDVLLSRFDLHNVLAVLRAKAGTQRPADDALVRVGWLVEPLAGEILAPERARGRRRPARPLDAGSRAGRRAAGGLRRVRGHRGSRGARASRRHRPRGAHRRRPPGRGPGRRDAAAVRAARHRRAQPPGRPPPARRAGIRRRDRAAAVRHAAAGRVDPARRVRAGPRGSDSPAAVVGGLAEAGWQPPLQRWAASGDLTALERDLERRCIADAAALFVTGDPLAIDVPVAFTAAKQTEARNLRLLGEASVRGIDAESVRRELLWPEARP